MSISDRIQRLEALLDRVRRRGRTSPATPVMTPVPAPLSSPPVPIAAAPTPVVAAPPPTSARPEPFTFEPRIAAAAVAEAPSLEPPFADEAPTATLAAADAPEITATLELVDNPPVEMLGEEDLVEMSSDVLESVPPPPVAGSDLDFDDEEEEPPISSERHRVATIEQAVAAEDASVRVEEGREVPLKTPPPESGPQEAALPVGIAAPFVPDVADLLDAELSPPPPVSVRGEPLPTLEQLGQTIELAEPVGPTLELDERRAPTPPPSREELEAELAPRESAPRYAAPEAAAPAPSPEPAPIAAMFQATEASLPAPPGMESMTLPAPGIGEARPEIVERPPISGISPIVVQPAPPAAPRPKTFIELLDASIALGG